MSENNREWFDEELYFLCLYSFFCIVVFDEQVLFVSAVHV